MPIAWSARGYRGRRRDRAATGSCGGVFEPMTTLLETTLADAGHQSKVEVLRAKARRRFEGQVGLPAALMED